MFSEMVEMKNASLIPVYYHPEFLLYTNGKEMDYKTFLEFHVVKYRTPIQYSVRYDEDTMLEGDGKVAGRVFITIQMPPDESIELEVMLVASYKEGKLHRLWELTYPDWSTQKEFESIPKNQG